MHNYILANNIPIAEKLKIETNINYVSLQLIHQGLQPTASMIFQDNPGTGKEAPPKTV